MMNGKYLLIALILLIVQVYCISTSGSRATEQEAVALEIFFKGSCRIVDKILRTMRVSSIGVADTCLPISTTLAGNPDNNDLNVHTLCRDINYGGKPRSLLRLVEIFQGSDDTVPLPAGINYVVSFISDLAFKVNSSDVSYAFRPSCLIERNVCNRSESIVSVCDDRAPNADDDYDRDGYIENGEERVYILQPGQVIRSCNTSATCCPYITTSPTSGICSFHRRPIPGQNRPNKPHRPNHHNNNHYDNDNHHDDHHNDNHHNNHHYNYSKQEEEVKTTTTEQVREVVAQPETVVAEKEVVAQPEAVVVEKVETPVVEETN